ncbi:hypothetical protein KY317_00070, partial [Candidatus Woesearchaeota archaeon]|nr:hypothetical protein [Candidatus Woesearchaeota archaeon]
MDPIIYFKGIKNHINGKTNWGCTAGRRSFSVDCDGAVQLCCNLKPFSDNIMAIDRNYFKRKKKEINKILTNCQKKCYSNCHFTTAYMIEHPIKAALGK